MKIPKIFELPPPSWWFIILRLECVFESSSSISYIIQKTRGRGLARINSQLELGEVGNAKKNMAFLNSNNGKMVGHLAGCFAPYKKQLGVFLFEVPKLVFQESIPPKLVYDIDTAVHIRGGHSSQVAYPKGVLL